MTSLTPVGSNEPSRRNVIKMTAAYALTAVAAPLVRAAPPPVGQGERVLATSAPASPVGALTPNVTTAEPTPIENDYPFFGGILPESYDLRE